MDIYAQYFLNYSPKLENIDPSTPKPQNTDIWQSFDSNGTIESPKKGPARATLLWWFFAKFGKSNIARAGPFFGLSIVQLLSNDCPISIFWGLGGTDQGFQVWGWNWENSGHLCPFWHFFDWLRTPPTAGLKRFSIASHWISQGRQSSPHTLI